MRSRWQRVEQVVNADAAHAASLTPASEAPAEAVRAGWAAVMPRQAVPLLGEVVSYVDPERV